MTRIRAALAAAIAGGLLLGIAPRVTEFPDVGAILLMHLNESQGATTFRDSSGNNFDGACAGTSCPARGEFGMFNPVLIFDGTNDFINGIGMGSAGTSDWTISAWVRTTDTSAGMVFTNRVDVNDRSMSLHVGFWAGGAQANGHAYFSNDGPSCEWGAESSTNIADGNFHHLVGVRQSLNVYRIYVDGALEGTTNITIGAGCESASADSTSDWIIGDGPAWTGSEWVGMITELSVYDFALSTRDVQRLYSASRSRHQRTDR